jgi:hypothetical protein
MAFKYSSFVGDSAGFAKDMETTIVTVLSHLTGYLIIVFILSGFFVLGSERYIS